MMSHARALMNNYCTADFFQLPQNHAKYAVVIFYKKNDRLISDFDIHSIDILILYMR